MTTDFVRAVLDAIGSASLEDVMEGPVAVEPYGRHEIVAVDVSNADAARARATRLAAERAGLIPSSSGVASSKEAGGKAGRRANGSSASVQLSLPLSAPRGKNGIAIEAAPPSIEDITNPDVLLAMLHGSGGEAKAAPEAPAKARARAAARDKTLNGILAEAPARKAASSASSNGAHASHGEKGGATASNGVNGAASEANAVSIITSELGHESGPGSSKNGSLEAAPASGGGGGGGSAPASETARPVSSGPRLRPGEEILRASAGGGAVIRRRRV